ncbi:NUDIX domain-containing protein [Anoxybacter fermentans]|uniref:NUDIX domain-containing protein n=1 Tax=Anoxybacter fermentans TaxID=1323375 RepID=UPI000F8DFC9D|nr:NUDIX domain-containing protein [Anoxybacter fermentans]
MIRVTAAIIEKDGKFLIARRKEGHLSGMWEFPGGKIEEGESPEECLKREIFEELGIILQ